MFLKSIDIFGFKSFADRTHIEFTDGVTALIGPNGCGKSNIVDAFKWVLGEQSMKTIRASRKEDVIFSGTGKRKMMNAAEVTLVIDNSDSFIKSNYSEISIKRRVFRTGESEYYLNGRQCLLRNISELFMDTGIGKSAYSVLEQGKIDKILSNKPEDRRYIFEEAAGISRYKQQCADAERKLERTDENILSVEAEANASRRVRDRSRAQAEKAKKAKELRERIFTLDTEYNIALLREYTEINDSRSRFIEDAKKRMETLVSEIEDINNYIRERGDAVSGTNREVNDLIYSSLDMKHKAEIEENRIPALEDRFRAQAIFEKEEILLAEEAEEQAEERKNDLKSYEDERGDSTGSILLEAKSRLDEAVREEKSIGLKISSVESEIEEKERINRDLEVSMHSLSDSLKTLIDDIVRLVDSSNGIDGRAIVERIRQTEEKLDLLLCFEKPDNEEVKEAVDELVSLFDDYISATEPMMVSLYDADGPQKKKEEIVSEEKRLRELYDSNNISIAEKREILSNLRADMEELGSRREIANNEYIRAEAESVHADEIIRAKLTAMNDKITEAERHRGNAENARASMNDISKRIKEAEDAAAKYREEYEELERRADELRSLYGDDADNLDSKRREASEKQSEINTLNLQMGEMSGSYRTTDEMIQRLLSDYFNEYSRSLAEFLNEYEGRDLPEHSEIQAELRDARNVLSSLGDINYASEDEYNDAVKQCAFYDKQLSDLEKAKDDLKEVLSEIRQRSEELFMGSFREIGDAFQSVFTKCFGGGRAEIYLSDPDNILESGITIVAQPPEKRPQSLELLSGGERTMTAVALLFATYQVKPSPFCILDEVDGQLDDRNIGNFLTVLDDYSKNAQFIIITHNKHTISGASSLLGVTQIDPGVSKIVSYRLDSIEGESVILDDSGKTVIID